MSRGHPPINDVKDAKRLNIDYVNPPEGMKTEERRTWIKLVRANPHLNSDGYIHLLEVYVRALVRHRELTRIIDAQGFFAEGSTGNLVPHPATKLLKDAEGTITSLSTRLSVSVAARTDLGKEGKSKVTASPGRPSVASKLKLA